MIVSLVLFGLLIGLIVLAVAVQRRSRSGLADDTPSPPAIERARAESRAHNDSFPPPVG